MEATPTSWVSWVDVFYNLAVARATDFNICASYITVRLNELFNFNKKILTSVEIPSSRPVAIHLDIEYTNAIYTRSWYQCRDGASRSYLQCSTSTVSRITLGRYFLVRGSESDCISYLNHSTGAELDYGASTAGRECIIDGVLISRWDTRSICILPNRDNGQKTHENMHLNGNDMSLFVLFGNN